MWYNKKIRAGDAGNRAESSLKEDEPMSKVEDLISMAKINDLLNKKSEVEEEKEKKASKVVWIFAVIGIVVALVAAAYGLYRFFTPDYLEEFEDDFDDDFDDDFFEDDEDEEDGKEGSGSDKSE